ncbi:hypothetical protein KA005_01840 [bacterium]|nr:hypothetical protein [bacterium]
MLELTVEAKVNNREFEFTFNQLKKLLSVVNDMIYGRSDVGRKEAAEIIKEMNGETAIEVLCKVAEKYPKILIECDDEVFDEEWGISETIKQNSFF